ncbi:MAG: 16S rRNA (guanine(966)-N(2))-methyltransferase RsmD [Gemmatimonadota bacterium]|nr:MAG: 16S rRNA (guanine(966)-N(2))-methyltransferase RsmD [Gemmatimonadota bacterium]
MRIIAGEWRGRRLKSPSGRSVRPTSDRVREAWMSAMAPSISGARVLDLFAGSGALGLETLSRGAEEVVFVERARGALTSLKSNIERLQASARCTVVAGDAMKFVAGLEAHAFDLAMADPPYDLAVAALLVERFAERPFARELWLEHRTAQEIPDVSGLRQRAYGDTTLTTVVANA